MAKSDKESVRINATDLLRWLDQYGPLCQFLDTARGHTGRVGFGVFQITMHGKRPVKAGPVGEMKELPQREFSVDMGEFIEAIRKLRG